MTKTIYIRDADLPTWDKAKEIAGEKLAPVIMEHLKAYVAENEARAKGFERIVVEYFDSAGLPHRKAFTGRWIIQRQRVSPAHDFIVTGMASLTGGDNYSVAESAKGGIVILQHPSNMHSLAAASIHSTAPQTKFWAFADPATAVRNQEVGNVAREAIYKRGVPIEELDI